MKQVFDIILDLHLPDTNKEVEKTTLVAQDLEKELLVLRMAFGKLKASALAAIAPIGAVFARMLTQVIWAANRAVKLFGQVIRGLFGISGAGKVVEKTVRKAGKSVDRSLASFDKLERLQKSSGGGTVQTVQTVKPADTKISQEAQAIVDRIKAILAPLAEVNLDPIRWGFYRLRDALVEVLDVAGVIVSRLWSEHLAPFLVWMADHLLPVLMNLATYGLKFVREALARVGGAFLKLLEDMKPVTEFLKLMVLTVFDQIRRLFIQVRNTMETEGSALAQVFATLGNCIRTLWETMGPGLQKVRAILADTFQEVGGSVFKTVQSILRAITGVIEAVTGLLTGDWKLAWQGMEKICKNATNGVIGLLNALLSGITGALNGIVNVFNKMKIKVPEWVPMFGGKEFGFHFKKVTAPQIPYLAKGAVLPANQPFLAMVGDQKHGTNIEAPLATIQEAVALVMGDQIEAMMAGFQALLQENRQLRRTVEGIEIGDTVIGQAAGRYNRRMAVMQGGVL